MYRPWLMAGISMSALAAAPANSDDVKLWTKHALPRAFWRFALAMVIVMSAITTGRAADEGFCRGYAAGTALDDGRNRTTWQTMGTDSRFGGKFDSNAPKIQSCGFAGPQWSSDTEAQYAWCLGQSEDAVQAARKQRLDDLRYCEMCADYVNVAFSVRKSAKDSFCPAPSTADADAMFKSCMAGDHGKSGYDAKFDQLKNDLQSSRRAVDTCKQQLGKMSSTTPESQSKSKRLKRIPADTKPCLNCGSASSDNANALRSGKPSTVPAAGLLEGDSGFSAQGPVSSGPRAPGASLPQRINR